MWFIDPPTIDQRELLRKCYLRSRNSDDRHNRFIASEAEIISQYNLYTLHAQQSRLNEILETPDLVGQVEKSELKQLYSSGMLSLKGAGRTEYEEIRNSTSYKICPYCGHRKVESIDHFLPKVGFEVYSINPYNLIPSCSDCNTGTGQRLLTTPENVPLHPYFDRIDTVPWLAAEIIEFNPPGVRFFVQVNQIADDLSANRALATFKQFKLGELYASTAAHELSQFADMFERLHTTGHLEDVRSQLITMRDSFRHANLNNWKTALFTACAESDEYCDGGFRI